MNVTAASAHDVCAAWVCEPLEDSRPLGVVVLLTALLSIAICSLNLHIIRVERLSTSFPVFHLIISQQAADMANIAYYVYAALCLINRGWVIFTTMDTAVFVGYWEGMMYGCQLIHHLTLATLRLLVSFVGVFPVSWQKVIKGHRFSLAAVGFTWAVSAFLIAGHYVLLNCELYYDVRYGYLSYATPEQVNNELFIVFWSVMERGCVGLSFVMYVAIFIKHSYQRHKTLKDSRINNQTTNTNGISAQDQARSKKQARQELNILYMCAVNVAVCAVNSMTWRLIGYLFNVTDIVNSVAAAVLSLVMVQRVRARLCRMLGCAKQPVGPVSVNAQSAWN